MGCSGYDTAKFKLHKFRIWSWTRKATSLVQFWFRSNNNNQKPLQMTFKIANSFSGSNLWNPEIAQGWYDSLCSSHWMEKQRAWRRQGKPTISIMVCTWGHQTFQPGLSCKLRPCTNLQHLTLPVTSRIVLSTVFLLLFLVGAKGGMGIEPRGSCIIKHVLPHWATLPAKFCPLES